MRDARVMERREELTAAARRRIAAEVQSVSEQFLPAVRPLVYEDSKRRTQIQGSCVLLAVKNRRFLVTAGHVFECPYDLYLGGTTDFVALSGIKTELKVPAGKTREQDPYDLAVMELSPPLVSQLGAVQFLHLSQVDVNEVPNASTTPRSMYLILGYPSSQLHRHYRQPLITPHALRYTAVPEPDETYEGYGLAPYSHLLLSYHRKKARNASGQLLTPPGRRGLSGGAILRFDSLLAEPQSRNRLVAILVGRPPANHNVVFGTRIAVAIEMIRSEYQSVVDALPASHLLKANIRRQQDAGT